MSQLLPLPEPAVDALFASQPNNPFAGYGLTLADLSTALLVWSCCNANATVAAAANVFRVSRDLVREAVSISPWLTLATDPDESIVQIAL